MSFGKFFAVVYLLAGTLPACAGVYVSSPSTATVSVSGSASATSLVHFVATATSPACSKGVAGMGIYTAPYTLAYTVKGTSLDTNLTLATGTYNIVVQEWDNCGWSAKASVKLTVTSASATQAASS